MNMFNIKQVVLSFLTMFFVSVAALANKKPTYHVTTRAFVQYPDHVRDTIEPGRFEVNGFTCGMGKSTAGAFVGVEVFCTTDGGAHAVAVVARCDSSKPGQTATNIMNLGNYVENNYVQIVVSCETTMTRLHPGRPA